MPTKQALLAELTAQELRAKLRRLVRRTVRKHGYLPDKQEKATLTKLEPAETLSAGWAS